MRAEHGRDRSGAEAREHDFEVIDSALRGATDTKPEDAALTSFAIAMKAARPEPEAGFVVELDERIQKLATAPVQTGGSTHRRRGRSTSIAAIGCVLLLAGVTALVAGQGGGHDSGPQSAMEAPRQSSAASDAAQGQGDLAAPEQAAKMAPEGTSTLPDPSGSPSATVESLSKQRQVVRTASLRLGTGLDDFTETTDEVIAITDRVNGFVGESSISDGTAGVPSGNFTLLIPSANFQDALASLSELGTVLDRSQNTEDVTATVNRVDRRLRRALATRRALLRKLESASTDSERQALRARVRAADTRIASIRTERRALQRRVQFVPLTVTVEASASRDDTSIIESAWDTAKSALEMVAAVLIVTFAIALPIGLLALIVFLTLRWTRRRNRARAIDAADSSVQAT